MPNLANSSYIKAVNRAIDHILEHLQDSLDLTSVSRAAGFSPYHFHRIFSRFTGETLSRFIKRTRLERSLFLMSHRPGLRLTEIALACGFSSSSDFSRSFREQYDVAPRNFDLKSHRSAGRKRLKLGRALASKQVGRFKVELRELPARRVAYVRVMDPFKPGRVQRHAERMLAWATERGLEKGQWLGYMWEDPDVVPLEKCRYDIGLVLPEKARIDVSVGIQRFEAMRVAEIGIAGPVELEQQAIDHIFFTWMAKHAWAPAHCPSFEAWQGLPFAHGDSHFELKVQIPVVRANTPA